MNKKKNNNNRLVSVACLKRDSANKKKVGKMTDKETNGEGKNNLKLEKSKSNEMKCDDCGL